MGELSCFSSLPCFCPPLKISVLGAGNATKLCGDSKSIAAWVRGIAININHINITMVAMTSDMVADLWLMATALVTITMTTMTSTVGVQTQQVAVEAAVATTFFGQTHRHPQQDSHQLLCNGSTPFFAQVPPKTTTTATTRSHNLQETNFEHNTCSPCSHWR